MRVDEQKILRHARGRDWYLTIEHGTGVILVVFRTKAIEVRPASEFAAAEEVAPTRSP